MLIQVIEGIKCGFSEALLNTRLTSSASATVPQAALNTFVPFSVGLSTDFRVDESSLTPSDGSHSFLFDDSKLEWRIDRVMSQVASLGNGSALEANWMSCMHNRDYPIALLFSDGECQLLKRPNAYPRQWEWSRSDIMRGMVANQSLRPKRAVVEIRAAEQEVSNNFSTLEQPQRTDGVGTLPLTAALTVHGQNHTQYAYRVGWEYGGNTSLKIDERRFVRDLRVIRKDPYQPRYNGSGTGTPEPIRIDLDESCSQGVTASWRNERAPLVHIGAPPDTNDTGSHYGRQP